MKEDFYMKRWKRCLAALLTAAMSLTMLPAPAATAAGMEGQAGAARQTSDADVQMGLLASFDFNREAEGGKFTADNAQAAVVGTAVLTERDAANGKALYLDGSASYLDVKKADGSSLLTGLEEATVSFDEKPDRTGTNWGFYAAPNANVQEVNKEHYIGALINGGTTKIERYNNNGSRPGTVSAPTGTEWRHVDVVFTETATTIYVDGKKIATEASSHKLTDILGGSSVFWIGKANWGQSGEFYKGWIDNFKVYGKALDEEEVWNVPDDAWKQALLQQQKAKVEPVIIDSETTVLPDYDGTVTWQTVTSEDGTVAVKVAEDGKTATAERPAPGQQPLKGKLAAIITIYGMTERMEIDVTVKPLPGANDDYGYMMVHFIEDSAGYAEKIYLDISRGDNPQQWDPLNGGQPILASDLGTTGVRDPFITRNPQTGKYYIIATDLRVFGADNAGWGVWQQNYSTKMNVWESEDLISWSRLRQFDVALNQAGEKQANMGMMWAPEATWVPDYYGSGEGAFVVYWSSQCYKDEAQTQRDSGSKIMWGATKDFTQETWEFGGVFLDGGKNGWIDTTIIQNGDKTYHITKSNDEQIIMESTTDKQWWKQGTNWKRIQSRIGESRYGAVEGPAVFKDHSRDNRWYLFVDDLPSPGYQPMVSSDLDKGWDYLDSEDYFLTKFTKHGGVISLTKKEYDAVRDADAVSLAETLQTVRIAVGATKTDLLAALPETVSVNKAYNLGTASLPVTWDISQVKTDSVGKYTVSGTVRTIGANKNQWQGKGGSTDYQAENKKLYSSTELKVSVSVRVSASTNPEEADASILADIADKAGKLDAEKYSTQSWNNLQAALAQAKEAQKPGATQEEIEAAEEILEAAIATLQPKSMIALFDFNQDAENNKFTSGQATAGVNGTVKLEERDAVGGKALYLDGSASYLDVKKADGGSLLAGLEEVTVSFDAKPDRNDTNWGFYAAPNANVQEVNKEHYIGALIKGGTTTIERYNNNGKRPKNLSVSTGSGWSHVDVVFTEDATAIYVDGRKKGTLGSEYALTDILGNSSIFQIGKANWGNGEYYKGWIDNFAIYGAALTDAELINPQVAQASVEEDLEDLSLASTAKMNFELPMEGDNFSAITWEMKSVSNYLKIQGNQAAVTRPMPGEADARAVLVATAKLGNARQSKEFSITIPALTEDEILTCIVIPGYVTGDLQSEVNGQKITWSCDRQGIVSADGKVSLPESGQGSRVTLTAKIGNNVSVSGEAVILPYGGSILTYVLKDGDLLVYKDSRRTDALFAAARSEKTAKFESLNKGKAILYVKWDGDQKQKPDKQMGSPALFRTADGALGVIAAANNNEEGIYLWDTKDQVTFTNERYIKLNSSGIKVQNPVMVYDSSSAKYKVFWDGDNGNSYLTVLSNLKDAPRAEDTMACTYHRNEIQGEGPENADMAQASEFVMSPEEYRGFVRKYGALHNTGMEKVNISIKQGQKADLPETLKAAYSDGSTKNLGVVWNQEDLKKLDTSKAGVYTIRGEVKQDAYAYPFIEERADPHIFYNEDDGYYYSTGSYYEENMSSCNVAQSYRKLDIRRAKTIEGLKTAQEHYLMESKTGDRWGGFFWAPEFHKINGTWYCLVGAHDFGADGIKDDTNWNQSNWCSQSILIPYIGDGDDNTSVEEDMKAGGMLKAEQWGEPIVLSLPSPAAASFDVSYYQAADGQGYYIIPHSANLFIIKVKGGVGTIPQPEGDAVRLKGLQWPWEYGIQENSVTDSNPEGDDQGIVEGPYLFEYGDKVYISYSGATVDKYYCLGLMMADKDSNLMDASSWTQVPYPVMSSYDTYEGKIGGTPHVGGGHNSVVLDEYGNLALIYHARPYPDPHAGTSGAGGLFDPCRHTVVKSVNVAYDGTLVFHMTAEEELDPQYRNVTATIQVTAEQNSQNPQDPIRVEKIKLNKAKLALGVKDEFTLKAAITPKSLAGTKVEWKSSDKRIVTVSKKGLVKGKKKGTATITAEAGGKTVKCKITVKPAPKKISLNARKKTLRKGKTFQIRVKKTPKNSVSNKITYKSSNRKTVTVSKSGKVKAIKKGRATITVTSCNGKKAKLKIIVK